MTEDELTALMAAQPAAIKKLMYRSWYRGNREMDNVLGHYALAHLPTMNDTEREHYAAFLEEEDVDMWLWLSNQAPAPEAYQALVDTINDYQQTRYASAS
jgi:antitoxin CptB